MYLKKLHLHQFRNYQDQEIIFQAPKTILVGENAQGKSNLLEAVELLSTLRSHRASRDRDLVLQGASTGRIQATLERATGTIELGMILRVNGRRTVSRYQEILRRQLDLLGSLNTVQFSSLDLDLVRGGPEPRRRWLDTLLIQLEPVYASILQQYHQVLRQRNALLKGRLPETQTVSPNPDLPSQLALWDAQLVSTGIRVIRRRHRAIARLAPIAQRWHHTISHHRENLTITYVPNVGQPSMAIASDRLPNPVADQEEPEVIQQLFFEHLQRRAIAEYHQGTTLVGPHRDDINLTINQTPARQYGSQGQQRTLVLALKLAELELIESVIQEPPLLLLDDVLAELDLNRQNQLLAAIQDRFQTLITTTHLGAFDAQWLRSSQILTVQAGHLST
ncbi:DNA replication/repair protein RecF [Trichothermofontia sichuanensis B231]|uniref:DNA replication/repair protein RecF n=1 Tax=Trichothermofontia sichuanensis TaxID=3045816 RepID=UPI002247A1C0|nr:DNA replication/repair protein RecF [Trichothermofontia sichuanensis]UZQ55643.1 DNA replication/repair protein RecF [Trichothermofontia sichuanensis B231]